MGVATRNGSPHHPQTQGKIERFHRTAKTYLGRLTKAPTLEELTVQLERLVVDYNQRPHSGIGYATPNERYTATRPASIAADPQRRQTSRKVWSSGNIRYAQWVINLGRHLAQHQVIVTDDGTKIHITTDDGTHLTAFSADTPKGYVSRT